jgi:transcriptional regulator with XRE-family HTH domain
MEEIPRKIFYMSARNIIGSRIRLAREKANPRITQVDLAARLQTLGLQVDQAAISRIESGTHEVTDIEASIIAKSLGVTIGWLFGETK